MKRSSHSSPKKAKRRAPQAAPKKAQRRAPQAAPKKAQRRAPQTAPKRAPANTQRRPVQEPVRENSTTKPLIPRGFWGEGGIDVPFLIIVLALLTIGLIMLFSSSYTYCYYNYGDSLYYFKKQLVFVILGLIAMFVVSKINFGVFKKAAVPLLIISSFLLVVVLVLPPPPGLEDFHRWISIPGLITFQPSEISKLAIILFFAWHIDRNYLGINNDELSTAAFAQGYNQGNSLIKIKTRHVCLALYMLILGITCLLVYMENHVSGAVLIMALGVMMLWLAGFNYKAFLVLAIVGVSVILLVVANPSILPEHASPRIIAWLDKNYDPQGVRWQTNNALYAIGSGGFFGVGLGNSKQKQLYVSEPQNDFIFSIVCEELGFVGALIIIALFALLVFRGFKIGLKCRDRFGTLLAMGLVFQVGLQAALNIGVVTDVLPNTGISLPFFSYGGTSIMMLLFQMGMVLSISRYSRVKKA